MEKSTGLTESELEKLKEYLKENMKESEGSLTQYMLGVFMAFTNIHNYLHKKLYKEDLK
jgi:hypothetical protein